MRQERPPPEPPPTERRGERGLWWWWFQIRSKIQLDELPRKYCWFRLRKTRVLQIAHWLYSLLDCSETVECSELTLSAQTSAAFMDLLSPMSKCVAEVFLILDLRVNDVYKPCLSPKQTWNLILDYHLQYIQSICPKHREIIQQSIFRELLFFFQQ